MAALKNAKHEAVAAAFIADLQRIGWKAYASVYPNSSEKAARTAWTRLLKNADFSARIAELKDAAAAASVMSLQDVLEELSKLGRANMQDFMVVGPDGQPRLDWSRLTRDQAAALAEVTVEEFVVPPSAANLAAAEDGGAEDCDDEKPLPVRKVKFKLHDKRGALAELRRHHSPERHEHTGKDGKPIEVTDPNQVSELEAARRIAYLLTKAALGASVALIQEKPDGT